MINWWVLRLSASQSRLVNARCHSLVWQLTVWQPGHTHANSTQGQWQTRNNKGRYESVGCCVCMSGESLSCVCECIWRPFSTTHGAVLTLHMAQRDLWPSNTALYCAAGYGMCIYTAQCERVYRVQYILLACVYARTFILTDDGSSGSENVQSSILYKRQLSRHICCWNCWTTSHHTSTNQHVVPSSEIVNYVVYGNRERYI